MTTGIMQSWPWVTNTIYSEHLIKEQKKKLKILVLYSNRKRLVEYKNFIFVPSIFHLSDYDAARPPHSDLKEEKKNQKTEKNRNLITLPSAHAESKSAKL